ncbi:MAG: phosphoribosylformylglycinamidine synthase II [Candidatus Fraserbacteria bacterium RBG_16_55_9]|uniref:Phosphoribosylformylglycinamidine synthase subunit PurL n=1 Tax=Fraserbacteria sp. (strain RBG_16_55_9) TaxID=1817864 RepID=A0A1F5UNY4_FRAXR|nr:MAG: phosphoribosylformylglycinamidine synthase II [Candidatus Fraserbacteria bacterium RBG_16_55_9]
MAHRIEVAFKPEHTDTLGRSIMARTLSDLGIHVLEVRTVEVYTLAENLAPQELELLGSELFSDPVIQRYSVDVPLAHDLAWDWLIEVGYKPGVTDSIGQTAECAIKELLHKDVSTFSSRQYLIQGKLNAAQAHQIAADLLANDLIERYSIYERAPWDGVIPLVIPAVHLDHTPSVEVIPLDGSDEELMKISRERLLALNLEEMHAIREHYRAHRGERERLRLPPHPTDAELESLAQNWSEHCKHKIFKGRIEYCDPAMGRTEIIDSVFKTFIQGATREIAKEKDWLVSVFEDNAGVIRLDEEYNLVFKVETHNSPSALDPYGGALTGIVGVNRDPMGTGMGCRLLFNTDIFCFADPQYSKPLPKGLKHPKRVLEGVRRGVEHGGNKTGIPTVNGTIRFDERFLGKPLVYCGTGGIMPARLNSQPSHQKIIEAGDLIVMVGGRIGADGIHGATFSSEALTEKSPTSAVQIGNPFVQKVMADMLLEARDLGLYKAIHDNGAGGISCSVGELAGRVGGVELHLEKAPLKYSGLDPWEILLSESQERMTVAVSPDRIDEFLELAKRRDVEASVLGRFTKTGRFHVFCEGQTVAHLDIHFLLDGHPQKKVKAIWKQPRFEEPTFPQPKDLGETLHKMLGRLNVCSKEYVIRQYDHEVQGSAVIKPLVGARDDGPGDAAVLWPVEMMRKGSTRGLVVANGINPNYGDIDTYHMAALALDEAIRNAVAVGADPERIAVLDNFCWSSSDDEFRLAQLVRACKALYEYAVAFSTPFISGKDSMYNDFAGELNGNRVKISVPPTILISALGIIDDIGKAITMDVKEAGNLIYLLGETREELGGSEYFSLMGEALHGERFIGDGVPQVDAPKAKKLYLALHEAMTEGLIRSCHDCSEGGLAVAASEMAFAGGLGMELDLRQVAGATQFHRDDFLLYSESPSRLLVEVRPQNQKRFEALMKDCAVSVLGKTVETGEFCLLGSQGRRIIAENIEELKASWKRPLAW